jgi:predicted metal-dependent hydrolase
MCVQSSSDGGYSGLQDVLRDPRYHRFFELFNKGEYFEAHEVLEEVWLPLRGSPGADFFKGLIQLAGAFVHERKQRVQPAIALLNLAEKNLSRYAPVMLGIQLEPILGLIHQWKAWLCDLAVRQNNPRPCLRVPEGRA